MKYLHKRLVLRSKILEKLIPAFRESDITIMTKLSASTIGYYRRKDVIPTFASKKKQYQEQAERDIRDTLEANKEYAIEICKEMCADLGIENIDE